jgi:hypothetical protein
MFPMHVAIPTYVVSGFSRTVGNWNGLGNGTGTEPERNENGTRTNGTKKNDPNDPIVSNDPNAGYDRR